MAKKLYWLKLKTDFFKSLRMKKLRKIAGGDTYTIIYLKLQLLSLENNGMLYYEGIEDSIEEELAFEIDEDVDNIKFTLLYLKKCGLVEDKEDNSIELTEVPLCTGSECDSAERVRKHRDNIRKLTKQKGNEEKEDNLLQCNGEALQCNSEVTKCNTEIEIEKEKEIEIDKDTDLEQDTEKKTKNKYQHIIDMFNDTCVSFPKVKTVSESRKKAINARLRTYTIEDFKLLFQKAESSSFLKGGNNRDWSANFDWLIKDANMAKTLDGNYDDKKQNKEVPQKTVEQVSNYGNIMSKQEYADFNGDF